MAEDFKKACNLIWLTLPENANRAEISRQTGVSERQIGRIRDAMVFFKLSSQIARGVVSWEKAVYAYRKWVETDKKPNQVKSLNPRLLEEYNSIRKELLKPPEGELVIEYLDPLDKLEEVNRIAKEYLLSENPNKGQIALDLIKSLR